MELFVLIGILLLVFFAEIIYYRIHALDNLQLKVDFSKNVADFGEDIELIEVAENRKRLPLPFIILKFEAPRELKFYDMANTLPRRYADHEGFLKAYTPHQGQVHEARILCFPEGWHYYFRPVSDRALY